jgi:hypothetical protein
MPRATYHTRWPNFNLFLPTIINVLFSAIHFKKTRASTYLPAPLLRWVVAKNNYGTYLKNLLGSRALKKSPSLLGTGAGKVQLRARSRWNSSRAPARRNHFISDTIRIA